MTKIKKIFISILLIIPLFLNGQYSKSKSGTSVIKIGATDLILATGSIRGELPMSKHFSIQLGVSGFFNETTFWNGTLNAEVKGYFIVPEIRYYVKGKTPTGFYLSPWIRYGELKARTTTEVIDFDVANYKIFGLGGMIGLQFPIRIRGVNVIVLDFYLGMGYNKLNSQSRFHQRGRLVPDKTTMLLPRVGISVGFQI